MYLKPEFEIYFLSRHNWKENWHIQNILGQFSIDQSENYCSNFLKIVSMLKIKQQNHQVHYVWGGGYIFIYIHKHTPRKYTFSNIHGKIIKLSISCVSKEFWKYFRIIISFKHVTCHE